jgi:hypothetical protein
MKEEAEEAEEEMDGVKLIQIQTWGGFHLSFVARPILPYGITKTEVAAAVAERLKRTR